LSSSSEFRELNQRLGEQDVSKSAHDYRALLIEGEPRGLSFVVELERSVQASGPWVKVDKDALLKYATGGRHVQAGELANHDEYDAALGSEPLSAEDYSMMSFESTENVDALYVAIDLVDGRVIAITPHVEPPAAPQLKDSGPAPVPVEAPKQGDS
jgi:hypothetical protein